MKDRTMGSTDGNMCKSTFRVLLDLAVFFAGFVVVMLMAFDKIPSMAPFVRGFFCDDQDLMYPIMEDTVSDGLIVGIALLFTPVIMLIVEYMNFFVIKQKCSCSNCKSGFVPIVYKLIGMYLIGGTMTLIIVEITKAAVGRLRPHFFEVCQPDWSDLNCTREFVARYNCTNPDEEAVINARKSFPSGHSAAACYVALYLVVYLHVRVHQKTSWARALCPVLETLAVGGALYVSVTRLQDYRHHPTDIIGGAVAGVVGSIVTILFHSDLPKHYLRHLEKKNGFLYSNFGQTGSPFDKKGPMFGRDSPFSYENRAFTSDNYQPVNGETKVPVTETISQVKEKEDTEQQVQGQTERLSHSLDGKGSVRKRHINENKDLEKQENVVNEGSEQTGNEEQQLPVNTVSLQIDNEMEAVSTEPQKHTELDFNVEADVEKEDSRHMDTHSERGRDSLEESQLNENKDSETTNKIFHDDNVTRISIISNERM